MSGINKSEENIERVRLLLEAGGLLPDKAEMREFGCDKNGADLYIDSKNGNKAVKNHLGWEAYPHDVRQEIKRQHKNKDPHLGVYTMLGGGLVFVLGVGPAKLKGAELIGKAIMGGDVGAYYSLSDYVYSQESIDAQKRNMANIKLAYQQACEAEIVKPDPTPSVAGSPKQAINIP